MRFTYRAAGLITVAVILTLLSGCSRTQRDWRAAQQAGTPQAYQLFMERHPDSELAGVARQRVAQLTEEGAWRQAMRANTATAYQDYLAKYPNGSWSQDARIRMESQSLTQAPQGEPRRPAASARAGSRGPAGLPPGMASGTVSPGAAQPLTTELAAAAPSNGVMSMGSGTGAAVQLGAFSSTANAGTQWRQLSSRFRSQLGGLTPRIIPVTLSGRRLYRLEARVASQSAAHRLCRQLQQHSQGCLPLP